MTESDLKRFLIRSIRAQGGVGHRFEDRFTIGWPDCLFIPEKGPVFFAEVKLLQGTKMGCTPMQEVQLERLHRGRRYGHWFCHGILLGYSEKRAALYIGKPGSQIADCRFIPRPSKLNSGDWLITELLGKFDHARIDDVIEETTE